MTTQRRRITELPDLVQAEETDSLLINDNSEPEGAQSKEIMVGGLFPNASSTRRGTLSTTDKVKLDGIESGAQANVPISWNDLLDRPNIVTYVEATSTRSGLMSGRDKSKLDGIETGAQVNVVPTWDSITGKPRIFTSLSQLFSFAGNAGKIIRVNGDENNFDYIDLVLRAATDATVSGDGTASSPLSVANPFTPAEKTKLASIEGSATEDQTPQEIRDALQTLASDDRLDASAIKNLPTGTGGTGGIASIFTNNSLLGSGTSADPLRVASPFSPAEKTKLTGIEEGATADQSADEVKNLLEALTGDDRLNATAIKNLPAGSGGGLSEVASDATLSGRGNAASPMRVTTPFTNAEKNKLASIEEDATADQTAIEIKNLYEGNTNTNAFTDNEKIKLSGIETNATADQSAAEIVVLLSDLEGVDRLSASAIKNLPNAPEVATPDMSGLLSASDKAKLDAIEPSATADQTAEEIKALYESNDDTNNFSDAYKTLVDNTPIFIIESINPSVLGSKLISAIQGDITITARMNNTEMIRRLSSTPNLEVIAQGIRIYDDSVTIPTSEDFIHTVSILSLIHI